MSQPYTEFRKMLERVRSKFDPDRYMFAVHPGERGYIEGALKGLGAEDIALYEIHEHEAVDKGRVLIFDREAIGIQRMGPPQSTP